LAPCQFLFWTECRGLLVGLQPILQLPCVTAEVAYSAQWLQDIERTFQFLGEENPASALDAAAVIRSAVDHLRAHPLVGRRVEGELREFVISDGRTGTSPSIALSLCRTRCAFSRSGIRERLVSRPDLV
jgi:plasmid stabilization system protein ParE